MSTGPRLLDLVRAELADLRQHGTCCIALSVAVNFHAGGHICADTAVPTRTLLYGPGLPFGENCPQLVALAQALGVLVGDEAGGDAR